MKKLIYVLSLVIILAGISCQKKIDIEKEKTAILKVLQEEGDAFAANDLNRLSATYIQDSTQTRLTMSRIYKGWDEVKNLYEEMIKFNSTDSSWQNPRNLKENIIIRVAENSAWVLCDNIWEYEFNNKARRGVNWELSILEKINGEWKFSFKEFITKPKQEAEATNQ